MKIPKQEYTIEFKELAVKRIQEGLTAGGVSKELGVSDQTLRNWVKAAATPDDLAGAEISPDGFGIHFPRTMDRVIEKPETFFTAE